MKVLSPSCDICTFSETWYPESITQSCKIEKNICTDLFGSNGLINFANFKPCIVLIFFGSRDRKFYFELYCKWCSIVLGNTFWYKLLNDYLIQAFMVNRVTFGHLEIHLDAYGKSIAFPMWRLRGVWGLHFGPQFIKIINFKRAQNCV